MTEFRFFQIHSEPFGDDPGFSEFSIQFRHPASPCDAIVFYGVIDEITHSFVFSVSLFQIENRPTFGNIRTELKAFFILEHFLRGTQRFFEKRQPAVAYFLVGKIACEFLEQFANRNVS